jgi:predicted alpha/beta-hydrolase family hydrolase
MAMKVSPVFLFAPGAGSPSTSEWMTRWSQLLGSMGNVVRFDYRYMAEGRKQPDPSPWLIETHRDARQMAKHDSDGPVILVGKSMGGRVGCHVSLVDSVAAVICLRYPLCANGDRSKLRDGVR